MGWPKGKPSPFKNVPRENVTKEKISKTLSGRKSSEDTRKKISDSLIGNQNTKGHRHSEETKEKISKSSKGRKGPVHTTETRIKIGAAVKQHHLENPGWTEINLKRYAFGEKMPEEIREKISVSLKSHGELDLPNCTCVVHKFPKCSETDIEVLLATKILCEFPEVEAQKLFPPYTVDFYLPEPYHLAFEADGEYWHQNKERDVKRDIYLLERFSLPVIRLTSSEIKSFCRTG